METNLTRIAKAEDGRPVHVQVDSGIVVVDDVAHELGEGRLHLQTDPAESLDVDATVLQDDGAADLFVVRASQREQDLVPISGHQSLEWISADDETDRLFHRLQKLLRRWSLVKTSCQSDRRRSPIFFGQSFIGVAGQAIKDVHPTRFKKIKLF